MTDRAHWSFGTAGRDGSDYDGPIERETPTQPNTPTEPETTTGTAGWIKIDVHPGLEVSREPGVPLEYEYEEGDLARIRREIGLALDPGFDPLGDLRRADITEMEEATEERMARRGRGDLPALYPSESWGHRVMALFLSLRRLTLHLEAYAGYQAELDHVVECAKLWRFPIHHETSLGMSSQGSAIRETAIDHKKVLSWDGSVDSYRWGQDFPRPFEYGLKLCELPISGFDVRIISFR